MGRTESARVQAEPTVEQDAIFLLGQYRRHGTVEEVDGVNWIRLKAGTVIADLGVEVSEFSSQRVKAANKWLLDNGHRLSKGRAQYVSVAGHESATPAAAPDQIDLGGLESEAEILLAAANRIKQLEAELRDKDVTIAQQAERIAQLERENDALERQPKLSPQFTDGVAQLRKALENQQ